VRAATLADADLAPGPDELQQRPSSRRRGCRFGRRSGSRWPRTVTSVPGPACLCTAASVIARKSMAQQTAPTAVGLEVGSDDGLDGTIGLDGEQSCAAAGRRDRFATPAITPSARRSRSLSAPGHFAVRRALRRLECPTAHSSLPASHDRSTARAVTSLPWSSRPRLSGSGCQQVGSLVAALVAEEKSADHSGELLRFVRSGSQVRVAARLCNAWASSSRASGRHDRGDCDGLTRRCRPRTPASSWRSGSRAR